MLETSINARFLAFLILHNNQRDIVCKNKGIQKGIQNKKYTGKENPVQVLTEDKSTTNRFIFLQKIFVTDLIPPLPPRFLVGNLILIIWKIWTRF